MYKFVIMSINGVRGCEYYTTMREALAAALSRTNISGMAWYVTAIKTRD